VALLQNYLCAKRLQTFAHRKMQMSDLAGTDKRIVIAISGPSTTMAIRFILITVDRILMKKM